MAIVGLTTSIFPLIFVLQVINAYSCINSSLIEIYGSIDKGSEIFYRNVGPQYTNFRQSFGVNVKIKKNTNEPSAMNQVQVGLVGPVNNPSTVFVSTPYTVPLHTNDVQFPLFAHGIVILYNLPGINNFNVTLKGISAIYLGIMKNWNDSLLKKYNPNAVLPAKRFIPVARMDDDASTVFFTNLLSTNDENWNHTYGTFSSPSFINGMCCNSTKWPQTVNLYGNTVVGMVGTVLSNPYTIGYAVMDAVNQYNVSIAGLLRSNDSLTNIVSPSTEAIQKTMYSYLNQSRLDDFELKSDTLLSDPSAYPLTVFSSFVLNYTYDSSVDCCLIQELVGFVDWFYDTLMDEYLLSQGYVPIIGEITNRIKRLVLPRIKCQEGPVYETYLKTIHPENSILTTGQIILITSICLLVFISFLAIFIYYTYYKKTKNNESSWLVDSKRIKLLQNKCSFHSNHKSDTRRQLSALSRYSSVILNNEKKYFKEIMEKAEYDEVKVQLSMLNCKLPGQWNNATKKTILKFKNQMSRNVARLLGITQLGSFPYTVFEFSSKGTLHYVLITSRYTLTNDIKYHFALDVAQGLIYLHHHKVVHGFLSSLTCYLDSSWTVKITGWEKLSIYAVENINKLKEEISFIPEALNDKLSLIRLLYIDPNLLKINTDKVDVFSFVFLLLEIFSRKLPYTDDVSKEDTGYIDILHKKFSKNYIVQPIANEIPNEIISLFQLCTITIENRPDMVPIFKELSKYATVENSIVDIVMETLESHADMLEEKVEERTAELKKIRHLPDEQLKIRIGINSGPVTAGVVGAKMPQYCVFGDTVNTASRMESTSLAQKIQLSETSYILLNNNFPEFFYIQYRGELDIKGKGMMRTYWLVGRNSYSKNDTNE